MLGLVLGGGNGCSAGFGAPGAVGHLIGMLTVGIFKREGEEGGESLGVTEVCDVSPRALENGTKSWAESRRS